MICSKYIKKHVIRYFEDVQEIKVLNDILTSYSHAKFNKIFACQNLRILFEFFISEEAEEFLSNYSGKKQDTYKQALDEIIV